MIQTRKHFRDDVGLKKYLGNLTQQLPHLRGCPVTILSSDAGRELLRRRIPRPLLVQSSENALPHFPAAESVAHAEVAPHALFAAAALLLRCGCQPERRPGNEEDAASDAALKRPFLPPSLDRMPLALQGWKEAARSPSKLLKHTDRHMRSLAPESCHKRAHDLDSIVKCYGNGVCTSGQAVEITVCLRIVNKHLGSWCVCPHTYP